MNLEYFGQFWRIWNILEKMKYFGRIWNILGVGIISENGDEIGRIWSLFWVRFGVKGAYFSIKF